jgi:hypothetical protein
MERHTRVLRIWLLLGLLAAVIVSPLARPMLGAWRCYARWQADPRAMAEVLDKQPPNLVLRLTSGPDSGALCTARTRETLAEPGQTLQVAYRASTQSCVAQATVERSGALLWALTSGLACVLGLIALVGVGLQRAFTRPAAPPRRMDADPDSLACPACGGKLAEGYLVPLAGVHWREPDEPIGMPHALGGLPGTVGWRGRPRLHAFRCPGCEILIAQYGLPPRT